MRQDRYTDRQVAALEEPLDLRLTQERNFGGTNAKYLDGAALNYQANRLFGYGNWHYEVLAVEQIVLRDPVSDLVVGVEYDAHVKVVVGDASFMGFGVWTVSVWDVQDYILQQREKKVANLDKKLTKEEREEATERIMGAGITTEEVRNARVIITQAHKQARKAAVTDGLKNGFRTQGAQFGNGLGRKKPLPALAPLAPLAPAVSQIAKWADAHYPGGFIVLVVDLDLPEDLGSWTGEQKQDAYQAIEGAVREARRVAVSS